MTETSEFDYSFLYILPSDMESMAVARKMLADGWVPVRETCCGGNGEGFTPRIFAVFRRLKTQRGTNRAC